MKLEQNKTTANEKLLRDAKAIRLFYVAMEKFMRYATYSMCVGHTYGVSSPYILPENMTLEEACEVVSHLTKRLEKEYNVLPYSERSVMLVSDILENYGFKRVDGHEHGHCHVVQKYEPFRKIRSLDAMCQSLPDVADLFTVSGDVRVFEHSDLNSRYFDWYRPSVSKYDIKNIYKRIGREDLLKNEEIDINEMA